MRLGHRAILLFVYSSFALSLARTQTPPGQPATTIRPGVVIEKVTKYSEAEKAGLAEGDVILHWSRGAERGEIRSPFDLASIEMEQAPRGTVALEGLRGTENKAWSLGQDTWGLQARSNFTESALRIYREGQELATAGKLNEAAEVWRAVEGQIISSDPPWLRAWCFFHIAEMQTEARHWQEADEAFQEAVQTGTGAGGETESQLLRAWGRTFEQRSDWPHAEQYYRQAIAGRQEAGNDRLANAVDLDNLGSLAFKRGDLVKADDYYQRALHIREQLAPGSLAVAASLNNLGNVADIRGDLDHAGDFDRRALTIGESLAPGGLTVAAALGNLGDVAWDRGGLATAEADYSRSMQITEHLAPGSLDVALAFMRLAWAARSRGDLAKAEQYSQQSLSIRKNLAPGSLDVAQSLSTMGNLARDRGDLVGAERYYLQGLAIRQSLAPDSLLVALGLNNLGLIAWQRGDLTKAEDNLLRALAIKQRLAPGSLTVASSFNNLGIVAWQRGNLAKAEEYQLQSLSIRRRLAPGSLDVAISFNDLGLIAWQCGDLAKAEDYHLQALAIRQKLAPGSLAVAFSLDNLMLVALERGQLNKAEDLSKQGLVIYQKLAPGSLWLAVTLNDLGLVARERGNLAQAEDYYTQAMAIRERLAPLSVDMARNLNRLGALVRERGDLDRAEQYYRRAFSIWAQLAPASDNDAESLAGLASIMRQRGQLDEAARLYEQTLRALEGQTAQMGGASDARSVFRAKYESYYQDYAGLLIAQGKTDLALEVLERSRARTLMEMLSLAHLDIHRGADPALLKNERSLHENITAKSDRRMRLLTGKHTEEQISEIDKEISGLRDEYQALESHIHAASPGYAALMQPQSLTAGQVRELLDGNTVLLEYSLSDERSYLFAVTQDAVSAYELPKRAEVEALARGVYDLLTARNRVIKGETALHRQARMAKADRNYPEHARQLSNMLLGPIGPALQGKRLLVVADGALQYIPFAALPDPQDLSKTPAPLVIAQEVVNLPSASVLAVMRRQGQERKTAPKMVAVLADPVFSVRDARLGAGASPQRGQTRSPSESEARTESDLQLTRSVRDVGLDLSRLPHTRQEAEAIFSLATPGEGMKALDFKATRAIATSPDLSQYRIVHFATHGLLDSQHPELSGLVLSLVDKQGKPQSGFLSLEDIYNLDLPAELVVLSACETGLGKEIKGEGLIGLTRGFMYAGANRVVASLWSVNDAATADLMASFYHGILRDKLPPAAALRQAQAQMWKRARWKSPYYWAAFQIQGDWK